MREFTISGSIEFTAVVPATDESSARELLFSTLDLNLPNASSIEWYIAGAEIEEGEEVEEEEE